MTAPDCDLCAEDRGLYEFSRPCCRVRFLLSLAHREARAGWLKIWRKDYGDEATWKTEQAVRAAWRTAKQPKLT